MTFFKKIIETSDLKSYNELDKQNEKNLVAFSSPDQLESLKISVSIPDNMVRKITLSDKYELSTADFLRLYTLFELAKYKQNVGDFPIRINEQVAGLYDYSNDTLFLFEDKNNLFNKINLDVTFILSKIMRNKHINKEHDFKEMLKRLKSEEERERAETLLKDESVVNICNAFWNSVIVYYKKFQNDVIYNFLSNLLKRYYLY